MQDANYETGYVSWSQWVQQLQSDLTSTTAFSAILLVQVAAAVCQVLHMEWSTVLLCQECGPKEGTSETWVRNAPGDWAKETDNRPGKSPRDGLGDLANRGAPPRPPAQGSRPPHTHFARSAPPQKSHRHRSRWPCRPGHRWGTRLERIVGL